VLVGPGSHWAQGGALSKAQIHALGYLQKHDVRALMQVSSMLVFPSLEEGFGLPVAEAFAAGLPVVCSRGSALQEVAGDAATLVSPLEAASIANGIEQLLDSPARAAELRAKGHARSSLFSWDRAAQQTLDFYRRVLAK
jgi:alpha-1,3-rhamnosyl/mannosyltransferase